MSEWFYEAAKQYPYIEIIDVANKAYPDHKSAPFINELRKGQRHKCATIQCHVSEYRHPMTYTSYLRPYGTHPDEPIAWKTALVHLPITITGETF